MSDELHCVGNTDISFERMDHLQTDLSNLSPVYNLHINQLPDGSFCVTGDPLNSNVKFMYFEASSSNHCIDVPSVFLSDTDHPQFLESNNVPSYHYVKHEEQQSTLLHRPTYTERTISPNEEQQKYPCIMCKDEFSSLVQYRDHLRRHKYEKKFKCSKCNAGYNVENNLKIHMVLSHPSESNSRCPICSTVDTFHRHAGFKSHLMVHQVEEYYTCDECKSEFDNEDDYMKHTKTHLTESNNPPAKVDNLSLTCSYCKLDFKSAKELRTHISEHVKVKRIFVKRKRGAKTKARVDKRYSCRVCHKKFLKPSLLERHERIHSGERPYQCPICEQGFSQKSTLQIHTAKHTGAKPFSCLLCPAKFSQKGNLQVHLRKTHSAESGTQRFRCSDCTCSFKRIASLNGHVTKYHFSERNSQVNQINNVMEELKKLNKMSSLPRNDNDGDRQDKSTLTSDDTREQEEGHPKALVTLTESLSKEASMYKVNVKKVGGVRWFTCDRCKWQFKKPSDLRRHMRIHTKDKPFKCHMCPSRFSLKSTLTSHVYTHNRERHNKCLKCDKCNHKFSSLQTLNVHIWKHDLGAFPKWQCTTCGHLCDSKEEVEEHKMQMDKSKVPHVIELFIDNLLKTSLFQSKDGNLVIKPAKSKVPNLALKSSRKTYHCGTCNMRFYSKVSLARHSQSHMIENKFKCACGKTFVTFAELKEHLRTHVNTSNHVCKFCDMSFVTLNLLEEHLVIHSTTLSQIEADLQKKELPEEISDRSQKRGNVNFTKCDGNNKSIDINNHQNHQTELHVEGCSENPVIQPTLASVPFNNMTQNLPVGPDSQTIYVNLSDLELLRGSSVIDVASVEIPLNIQSLTNQINSKFEPVKEGVITEASAILDNMTFAKSVNNLAEISPNVSTHLHEAVPNEDTRLQGTEENSVPQKNDNLGNDALISDDNKSAAEVFDGNMIVQSVPPLNLNEAKNIFDANIICMGCSRLFSNLTWFQNHYCEDKKNGREQETECVNLSEMITGPPERSNEGSTAIEEDIPCVQDEPTFTQNENDLISEATNKPCKKGDKGLNKLECHICKLALCSKTSYDCHMKTHSFGCNYVCSICKQSIKGRATYLHHLKQAHADSNGVVIRTCTWCSKEFKKPSDLARHIRVHTGEKPFGCKSCGKGFSLKSTLESHEKTHKPSQKNFNCHTCNAYFTSKATLKNHVTIHTGQKPYPCQFCDMTFRTAGSRKSHVIITHILKKKKPPESKRTKILESVVDEVVSNVNNPLDGIKAEAGISLNATLSQHQLEVVGVTESLLPTMVQNETFEATANLLQELQSSNMILASINDNDVVSPLVLDDVSFLNLAASRQNLQILTGQEFEQQNPDVPVKAVTKKSKNTRDHTCPICHKMYSKDGLRKHIKSVHQKSKEPETSCKNCGNIFGKLEDLDEHLKICNHGDPGLPYLHQHNQTVNDEREFQFITTHEQEIDKSISLPDDTVNNSLLKFDVPSVGIEDPLFLEKIINGPYFSVERL